MVDARFVISNQNERLSQVFHNHAPFAQLRRLDRLHRIGFGPTGNPAKVFLRKLPDPVGVHIPHNRDRQITRRIVVLKKSLCLGTGQRFNIAHVTNDLVTVRMRLVRDTHEFFEQAPYRPTLNSEPPFFHDHVLLLVKLPEHNIGKPVRFHQHPEFHFV